MPLPPCHAMPLVVYSSGSNFARFPGVTTARHMQCRWPPVIRGAESTVHGVTWKESLLARYSIEGTTFCLLCNCPVRTDRSWNGCCVSMMNLGPTEDSLACTSLFCCCCCCHTRRRQQQRSGSWDCCEFEKCYKAANTPQPLLLPPTYCTLDRLSRPRNVYTVVAAMLQLWFASRTIVMQCSAAQQVSSFFRIRMAIVNRTAHTQHATHSLAHSLDRWLMNERRERHRETRT